MPPNPPIRETEEILPLRGMGGFMEFEWVTGAGVPRIDEGEKLAIQEWKIFHRYTNVKLAMSGGKGSMQKRRVIDDFDFITMVDLDLTPPILNGISAKPNEQPFYDGRLQGVPAGKFHIGMRFQCGDPSFWSHPELQSIARVDTSERGVFYWSDAVILDEAIAINASRGLDEPGSVVTYIVRGSGSAPLQRFINETTTGQGAFDNA